MTDKYIKQINRTLEKDLIIKDLIDSKELKVNTKTGKCKYKTGNNVPAYPDFNGYIRVVFTKDKKEIKFRAHRCVMIARSGVYLENGIPVYKEIDHIDGNRSNNNYKNLRWTDRSGNLKGTRHGDNAKVITLDKVIEAKQRYKETNNISLVARQFNVNWLTMKTWLGLNPKRITPMWKLRSPDGLIYITSQLSTFTKEFGFNYSAFNKGLNNNIGKYKGWSKI